MKSTDIVFLLMLLTFMPFNEGIIAKAPRWQNLSNKIDEGVLKFFRNRAESNIYTDILALAKYFKYISFCMLALLALAQYSIGFEYSQYFMYICIFAIFSWFSILWTFAHDELMRNFSYLKLIILIFSVGLVAAGIFTLMPSVGKFILLLIAWPLQFGSDIFEHGLARDFIGKSIGILIAMPICYILGWILLPPFAFFVLLSLKFSKFISDILYANINRALLYEFSVAVQIFGTIYLFWIGRQNG